MYAPVEVDCFQKEPNLQIVPTYVAWGSAAHKKKMTAPRPK